MHTIRKMSDKGDEAIATWAPGDVEAETKAKAIFDRVMAEGKAVFAVETPTGEHDVLIKAFDPAVREYLVLPQVVGG